ncbi:cell division protein FtsH [bacterium]|nr:cell division protein FtsH [bacterium]MBD62391.1 cell division protein FtsH [bacterium]
MKKNKRNNHQPSPRSLFILFFLFLTTLLFFSLADQSTETTQSEFVFSLESGAIEEVQIDTGSNSVSYKVFEEDENYISRIILSDSLLEKINEKVSNVRVKPPGWGENINPFVWFALSIGITVLIFVLLLRKMGGGGDPTSFGQSKAKSIKGEKTKTKFKDVAGLDEPKNELKEIVSFLKNPAPFKKLGAKPTKGVLLTGPPGCGKTLLAKAVAGEAKVPFFLSSGSEFVELFVGVGASRVRSLFEKAKAAGSALIFLDEIDAVGRQRGAGMGGGHDEREQTLNQILIEMDGFESHNNVVVIAATNRPDILDPALIRSGRFDRKIKVNLPTVGSREDILKVHSSGKPFEKGISLKHIAQRTPGFSGADLENLLNESALLAARAKAKKIKQEHLAEAVERVAMGPQRRSLMISQKEKETVAWHESGHAIVSYILGSTVHKITIIPRAEALGYVWNTDSEDEKDKALKTKKELMNEMAICLAGRAAEKITFNEITNGASSDIKRVTSIARSMVRNWGMSDKIGPVDYEYDQEPFLGRGLSMQTNHSDAMEEEIDRQVLSLVTDSQNHAEDLLQEHKDALDGLANILLEKESIDREDFEKLMKGLSVERIKKND